MCQQLGKKRPRSSISNSNGRDIDIDIDSDNTVKQGRKTHFSESSADDAIIGRSESITHQYQQDQEGNTTINNVWYTKTELAVFTSQARDHVLGRGNRWMDQNTRGYERYDFARAQQKAMTRKIILLLMQQKVLSDEEKSLIAHRSSAWAVDEAFVTGCKDFCEAYHPHMSHLLQQQQQEQHLDVGSADAASDTSSKVTRHDNKRKLTNQNQSNEDRNVRSRAG